MAFNYPGGFQRELATADFDSFDKLNNNTLMPGDTVTFHSGANTFVFDVLYDGLKLREKTKRIDFFVELKINPLLAAKKAYQYTPTMFRYGWPTPKLNDMDSLTRLCLMIFAFLEGAEAVNMLMRNRHWKLIEFDEVRF